jgi:MFS family permease
MPLKYIVSFCVACFFFWATQYLYVPILPVYAESVGASLFMVGLIIAFYSIPQLFLRIPAGILFDSIKKRKPLLVAGILLASLGALWLGLAQDPWSVLAARAVTGVASATWVSFIIYFMGYFPHRDAGKAISILNFTLLAAMVVATFSGGLLAHAAGYAPAFFGAAALGIVALVAVMLTREPVIAHTDRVIWKNLLEIAKYRPLLMVSFLGFLSTFADWAGLFSFLPIYAAGIGASSADLGIITMSSMATAAVGSLAVVRITKTGGNISAILLGSALSAISIAVVPIIRGVPMIIVAMLFNGLGRGLLMTLFMSMSVRGIKAEQRATAMGFFQAVYALGMAGGPWVSGLIAGSFGLSSVFYLSAFISLSIGAVACIPAVRRIEASVVE